MAEKPHETLNRAADLLEKRASDATEGPWTIGNHKVDTWGTETDVYADVMATGDKYVTPGRPDGIYVTFSPDGHPEPCVREADALWMATMSPAVTAPLAVWLRCAAQFGRFDPAGPITDEDGAALRVARMVLGEDT